jgi:A/G-specific adenine glycosylase
MTTFATRLIVWFDAHGRHDLPWQRDRTPYSVWVSEIMLQQTQVGTVIPFYSRFMRRFPTIESLAAASLDDVLVHWAGLGYYARARNLWRAAHIVAKEHGGELPSAFDALHALPGVGRSTAGAILAQAHGQRHPILDGNVKRVLARYHGVHGWPGTTAVEKELWQHAETHLPGARLADYTQAIMDFGATLCTRSDPACVLCPMQDDCVARIEGLTQSLPTPKPGKALPTRRCVLLVLRDEGGRILLIRRPPTGVWAGLWSLPEMPDHDSARAWFTTHIDADFDHADAHPELEHVFSHYRLQAEPLVWGAVRERTRVADDSDLRWTSVSDLPATGLPAPIRKLLGSLVVNA